MAKIWADRVAETSTTTGTGDFTLAGAVTGFRAFSAVCATNDAVEYMIEAVDASGAPTGAWEVGYGTYSAANTLTRTLVRASTNAGAAVSFAAGTKNVTLVVPATLAAGLDGTASGTSFPGSPSSGAQYYRTDRNIRYFYDGTRWLSEQLFTLTMAMQDQIAPINANTSYFTPNPHWGLFDIYVMEGIITSLNTATTASNYFTHQFHALDGVGSTNLGSTISGQGDTQNSWIAHSVTINAVVASTVDTLRVLNTESGSASCYFGAVLRYRLVG